MLIGQGSYDNVRGECVRGIALISSGMRQRIAASSNFAFPHERARTVILVSRNCRRRWSFVRVPSHAEGPHA